MFDLRLATVESKTETFRPGNTQSLLSGLGLGLSFNQFCLIVEMIFFSNINSVV